ncbi:MAG: aminodeoxychorismate/anthranilate synthase component II [Candidatus Hadarchaeales archaeon]
MYMRVAVVDNIDSFVYNLVQYVGELGAEPFVFMNRAFPEEIGRVKPDRIIISPGPGRPENAGNTLNIIRKFAGEVPILGVCLGHQAIGYEFGGKVVTAKHLMHGKVSMIKHDGSRLFRGVTNPFGATRYHSLVLEADTLPECLRVTACTDDNDREIMGIEHVSLPIFGVQFHPESVLTTEGMKIIRNFLEVER